MGQRANLIIVDKGDYRLFYDHHCANKLESLIFWGPGYTLDLILSTQECPDKEKGWLDDLWADGAVLLDLDASTLIFFDMEFLYCDIPLRRVYLDLMQRIWKGWKIHYARRKISELAQHVGYPIEDTATLFLPDPLPPQECFSTNRDKRCGGIASIRDKDGRIKIYVSSYGAHLEALAFGKAGLDELKECPHYNELPADSPKWGDYFPTGGFHIDEAKQTLYYWNAYEKYLFRNYLHTKWRFWRIQRLEDRFETHSELTDGKIQFPVPSRETLVRQIGQWLLRDMPVRKPIDLASIMAKEGITVEENPLMKARTNWRLDFETRLQIWKSVLEQENPPIDLASTLPEPKPESNP